MRRTFRWFAIASFESADVTFVTHNPALEIEVVEALPDSAHVINGIVDCVFAPRFG